MRQHKRVIAVLFCDLVGSTELTLRMDAEDIDRILADYRSQVSSIVEACGGHVARALGDGILAYFGYPSAHEHDASRAVRAAISIVDGLISSPVTELRVRIGVSLGEVLVSETQNALDDRPAVVGHAVNLAARIQSLASPDTVLVSEDVFKIAKRDFKFRDLGAVAVKGVPAPERIYLALSERTTNTVHPSSLVGREAELTALTEAWGEAKSGVGSTILVSGEPGIGKSRLAWELQRLAQSEGAFVIRMHSASHRKNSDHHALHDLLKSAANIQRGDALDIRRRKLERYFALFWRAPAPSKLLECLIELGDDTSVPFDAATFRQQRDTQIRHLLAGFEELSRTVPILLVHEDAQWLDPTSEEWLTRLVSDAPRLRLLVLVTARRDYVAPWMSRPKVRLIAPRRLDDRIADHLVQAIPGVEVLPDSERADIVERAEGVPLFLEELARDAVAQHRRGQPGPFIPLTLNAALLSRLEAAPSAKRVAQMAAVLGRTFEHDTAALVWGRNGPDFEKMIEALMSAEIIRPRPVRSGARYEFRHALLQEVAYASLLREERTFIHARVVDVLLDGSPDEIDDHPELIAYHCDCADRHALATRYWLKSGQSAARRGAVSVAANSFRMGLSAAARAQDEPPNDRLRFELHLGLGSAVMAESGYTSKEALDAFEAAQRLAHCAQTSHEQLQLWLGLFNAHFGRGELSKALKIAQIAHTQLLPEYGGYPVLMGQVQCYMGHFEEASRNLVSAIEAYNPSVDANLGLFCRADVVATSFLAKVEFARGQLGRSAELTAKALSMARKQGHPIALAIAMMGQLFLLLDGRKFAEAGQAAQDAYAHAVRNDLSDYKLWLSFILAMLQLRAAPEAALAKMSKALAAMDKAETLMFRPAQLAMFGGALDALGRPAEALAMIEEGLRLAEVTAAREAIPALLRLHAKVVAASDPQKARGSLERSLVEAQRQGAVMEELRTVTQIAHLLKASDNAEAARALLAPVYEVLPKDFDHPDLGAAARLLVDLQ